MRVGIQSAFQAITRLRRFSERKHTEDELAKLSKTDLLAQLSALSANSLLLIDAIEKIDRAPRERIYDLAGRAHTCVSTSTIDQAIVPLAYQLRPLPPIEP